MYMESKLGESSSFCVSVCAHFGGFEHHSLAFKIWSESQGRSTKSDQRKIPRIIVEREPEYKSDAKKREKVENEA